jgi:soluble lytic murein transglycosylase-like protein
MAQYTNIKVDVPDINKTFGNYGQPHIKKDNIAMIRRIQANYGTRIRYWGDIFEIPEGILIGFIATESGGKMAPANQFLACGLMQMTPGAFHEAYTKWGNRVKGVAMPTQVVQAVKAKLPAIISNPNAVFSTLKSGSSVLLKLLVSDSDFNIMAGTMTLRWFLEWYRLSGIGSPLNKAIVAYNAGGYRGILTQNVYVDTLALQTSKLVPSESRNYLVKMLGEDGFLDLIYREKAI